MRPVLRPDIPKLDAVGAALEIALQPSLGPIDGQTAPIFHIAGPVDDSFPAFYRVEYLHGGDFLVCGRPSGDRTSVGYGGSPQHDTGRAKERAENKTEMS